MNLPFENLWFGNVLVLLSPAPSLSVGL